MQKLITEKKKEIFNNLIRMAEERNNLAKRVEKELKRLQKEVQQQIENSAVKPDTIKTTEILQQTMTPIKKKETVKTIEVKEEQEQTKVDQFAPIPVSVPIGN